MGGSGELNSEERERERGRGREPSVAAHRKGDQVTESVAGRVT